MAPEKRENHPKSPCNKCKEGETCTTACEIWRKWFVKCWTSIQGKDSKATETWEQQFAKKWTGIQIAAGLRKPGKEAGNNA